MEKLFIGNLTEREFSFFRKRSFDYFELKLVKPLSRNILLIFRYDIVLLC